MLKINTKEQFATNNYSERPGHFHWYTIVGDSDNYPKTFHLRINDRYIGYLKPLKIVSSKHLVYFGHFTEQRMLEFIHTWRKQEAIERR